MHITHFAFLLQQARFASVLISCFQNACLFYCFREFYFDSNLILFRLGSPCVHVVSVLFRIETAHRLGVSACTSLPCSWTVPAFKSTRAPPSKLKELEVSKPVHSLTCGTICFKYCFFKMNILYVIRQTKKKLLHNKFNTHLNFIKFIHVLGK